MVYEKKKSGDPDYDDKQPPEFHAGGLVVSAGDGVILSPTNGPVDENGAHVNLATDEDDLDNRPAPGETATAASEVQQYREEDTPAYGETVDADSADVEAAREGQRSVRVAAEAQGQTEVVTEPEAETKAPAAKKSTPAKDTSSK